MDNFINTILQLGELNPESLNALCSIAKKHSYPARHILLRQDSICNHLYYIEKGLSRTFYIKNGKDVTDWISTECNFAVSLISFINRTPDRRFIELLEPSLVYALEYQELEGLCSQVIMILST